MESGENAETIQPNQVCMLGGHSGDTSMQYSKYHVLKTNMVIAMHH